MKHSIVNLTLFGLVTGLLLTFLPASALAQGFGVSPSEVEIDNLAPGQTIEFELSIRNKDELPQSLTITTFQPPQDRRRQRRTALPNAGWISFTPAEIELTAESNSTVTVVVAIPPEHRWAGHDWEIWLGVVAESDALLAAKVYVRVLVSTGPAARTFSPTFILAVIAGGVLILGGLIYYYYSRRKAKPA